jgi:hypothetical protein
MSDDVVIEDEGVPATDGRDPGAVLDAAVRYALALLDTWVRWDGQPIHVDDRVYTPHKAVRRIADHLLDHLAEVEARLVGEPTYPDDWEASASTTPADLAPFLPEDRTEAAARLRRLAQVWTARLRTLEGARLDATPGEGWSARQIAFHLAETVYYYADSVGSLA